MRSNRDATSGGRREAPVPEAVATAVKCTANESILRSVLAGRVKRIVELA
jgi:hypothetical protein